MASKPTSVRHSRWFCLTGDALTFGFGVYFIFTAPWPAGLVMGGLLALVGLFLAYQDVQR